MANLFQAWDEDIQALGAAKASDDQIEARRQQLAEHFKAKAKAAGLSSKKIYETLDQFDAYSRQKTTAQDDQLTPEEQEMAQRVKDGTVGAGAMKEVGKRFKDVGLGVVSSLTRMGGDVAQTWADVGDNDKSELSSQIAQGLYNATDDIRSNYSEGTKQAKKDFWSPAGLTMGVSENLGQIAGTAALLGTGGAAAGALGVASKAGKLATMAGMAAPLAYSQGYGQGKESSLDEINKTSNAQLWENVKAEAKAYDDAGGTGEVPYLVGMFKEAGGDLNLMKDLMAENAGNRSGIMTVATEPLAMGVGSVMSRGAAAGGTGVMAKFANAMNNQGMSNELARRIAAGASAAEARKAGQIVGTTALRDNAAIASQAGKIAATQMAREGVQETAQEGLEGYYAKGEGSRAAGRKGELNSADWSGENGIVQQGLQGGAIGMIMGAGGAGATLRNSSKLALEKNGLPEKHDAAITAHEQAIANLEKATQILDLNPEDVKAQEVHAKAYDEALVATNNLEQLTGKFNALYTPEEQEVIKAKTMEGIAARKKVADDAAKAQKELDDAQAKAAKEQEGKQAEVVKAQRENTVNKLASMVGDEAALNEELARLNLGLDEENALLVDAHKIAKKQKKTQASTTATPKTPIESAVDMLFDANGKRNTTGAQDAADKHKVALPDLIIATSDRIAQNEKTNQQKSDEIAFAERQAEIARQSAKKASQAQKAQKDAEKSDVLSEKQQLENTLADFAANNDHDSMVNFLSDYEPTEADKLIKNAYASVESKKQAEQDAIAATKQDEAAKAKKAEDDKQAEQKKIAFNNDMANLYAANPDRNPTKAELDSVGKKHGVKSPIELAQAWVKAKNEAKAAKEAAPKLALPSPETATKDERDITVPTGMNINRDNIENQDRRPIIVRNDGKPFPTQAQAEKALEVKSKKPRKKKEKPITKDTHEVIPVDGGFAIAPVVEVDDKKREAQIRSEINAAVEFYPDVLHKYAVENGLRESNDYSIMTSDMKKQIIDAVVKKELSKQNKKPDDNEDGGVIADAPKPNAPVSPAGQQAVSPTGEQVVDTAPTPMSERANRHKAHIETDDGKHIYEGTTGDSSFHYLWNEDNDEVSLFRVKLLKNKDTGVVENHAISIVDPSTGKVIGHLTTGNKNLTDPTLIMSSTGLGSAVQHYAQDPATLTQSERDANVKDLTQKALAVRIKLQEQKIAMGEEMGVSKAKREKEQAELDRLKGLLTPKAPTQSIEGEYQHNKIESAKVTVTKTDKGYDIDWGDDGVESLTGKNAQDKTLAILKTEGYSKQGQEAAPITRDDSRSVAPIQNEKDAVVVDSIAPVAEAQHIEKGLVEEVTHEVIRESLDNKPSKLTPIKPAMDYKTAKAWLLGEAEKALANSKTIDVSNAIKQRIEYNAKNNYVAFSSGSEKEKVRQQELKDLSDKLESEIGYVTFDVPNDGKFKVLNTKKTLERFIKQVKTNDGFSAPKKQSSPSLASSQNHETTVKEFMYDAELDNIYEFSRSVDKPMRFGVGKDKVTAYALTENININGFDFFVGLSLSKDQVSSKTYGHKWYVIEPKSGLSIGVSENTKSAVIAEAKIALNKLGNEKLRQAIDNALSNKTITEAEREKEWLASIGHNPDQNSVDAENAAKKIADEANAKEEEKKNNAIADSILNELTGENKTEKAKQEATKEEPIKWFGTQDKADEWVAKQKGKTFDIRKSNGRFEIYPAKEQPQGNVIAKKGIVVSNAYGSDGWRIISDVKDTDEMVTVIENENMLSERKLTMNMESFKERLKQDAEGRKQYQQAQDKSVQNNEPAPTKQPETKTEPRRKIDFSEASVKLEDALNKWEAIKKGDIVITKSGRALIAQSDAKGKMSIRFKAREGGLEEALSVFLVTGNNKVSKMMAERLNNKTEQELPPQDRLVGKNSEGKDLYEDSRGVRFFKQSGAKVYEGIAIGRNNNLGAIQREDEYRTVEEVAARQPKPQPKEEKPAPAKEPSKNTIFTEDAAEKARAILRKKLGGNNLYSGIDPEILQAGLTLAGYHIEKGARSFVAYAKAMTEDMGDMVKPYLKSWYMGVKYDPRAANFDGMSSAAEVDSADIEAMLKVDSPKPKQPTDKGDTNESQGNGSNSTRPLENVLPEGNQPTGEEGDAGQRGNRGGKTNTNGNGRANAGRSNRGGGVAAGQNAMDSERPSQELAEQELAEEAEKVEDKTLPGQPRTPKKLTGVNPGNYRITEADKIGTGTPGERLKQNLEAIRLVRTLQAEGRYATKEEQAVLAKYVGWGGLANAFDEASKQKQYREANAELKRLLSPEEYTEALLSTRNAHYTSPKVIKAMYDLVRHLGFMGGNVLEPTVGSGNFIGLMPEDFAASSNWYAAEIDPITGALAQYLYPEGQVMAGTGFQDAEFAYGKFDLAIGNPPFGDTRITDRNKARQHLTRMKIHNYIISKSGMHLRPGGVMAMVITHRFLDTKNDEARAELAKNFRFVGAIRLPNTAFKENANTEVTTDIVVFQKLKPGEEATTNLEWLDTSATIKSDKGQDIRLNGYFAKHPEMMLGKPTLDGTMYAGARGDEFTLEAIPDMDLEQAIADRIKTNLADQAGTMDNSAEYLEAASAGNMVNRADVGIGGFLFEGGKLSMREADDANGNPVFVVLTPQTKWTEKTELGQKRYDRIIGMLHLRQQTIEMIALEMADAPVKLLDKHRALLNKSYDAFVKEHGFLADPANSKLMDGDIGLEFGLENSYQKALSVARAKATGMKQKPASAKKADILSRRVFTPHKVVTSADTAKDGYLVSLSEHGKLDLPYISELTGKTIKQVTDELSSGENPLIFMNPKTEQWEQHDEYLSGNVKAKHQEAVQAGLEVNAKALEAVFPEDVKPNDLHITVRSSWLPIDHFVQFLDLIGVKNSKVSVNPYTGTMYVSFGEDVPNALSDEFKNDDYTISEMLGNLANGKVLTAYDREPDGNGNYKRVVNKDRTAILSIQSKKMKELFNDWMRLDDNRMQEAAKAFNEKMNTHSAREYNGAKMLVTVGASPSIKLLNTQKNAAWRMIQSPVILLDHVVGAGKTFTLITGIMERRRLGLSRKPAMVVPNHLVGQWAKDFYALYPAAKLLAISEKDFAKSNRQRLFARMATGNFDAIIMGHSSLKFIQVSAATESKMVREEIEYLQKALAVASESEDKRTVKTLANQISKKMERFKALGDIKRDTLVEWEQMGIDYLGIDESHEFKNLEYSTSMQRVTGMNDPKGSQRAFDLYTKIRELRSRGGGVAFATGTPISNSLVEMYTILRYLNRDELKARGNDVFDAWVGTYGEVDTRIEYTATQKLKSRNVLARFGNLPELLQLYNEVADTVTMTNLKQIYAEQVREANKRTGETKSEKMPIPPVKGGGRQLDVGDLTAAQNEYMDYLVARAERIEEQGGKNDPKIDNLLWISNDARKMSLDMRLVDPMAQDSPDSKVNRAANNIKRIYDDTHANKGTQLVFCDLSTPKKGADKEGKKIIKAALEKLGLDNDNRFARMMEDEPLQIQWRMIMDRADNIIEDENTDDATRERIEDWLDKLDSDIEGILLTADSGFSVYDALKQTLVDQGIPENEIAFIHDYNSKEQKSELFGLVNDGSIRVLLGSSPKMGAGTNVQKRLVALHHMDAPWRPSDVEQREGRIIRQGNLFATPPTADNPNPLYNPNFEVEITAYSTNRTFDTVMWQTLQRKASMIEQFRSGEREMVEPNGDAAGYAEFMAQSTGNPAFKRKIEIEGELNGLQAQKRSYMAKQGEARRFLENYESEKARALKSLEGFKDGPIDSATYNGKTYANDYEAARQEEEAIYREEFEQWDLEDKEHGPLLLDYLKLSEEDKAKAKKPKTPKKPAYPTITSKRMQAKSEWSQMVAKMMEDAEKNGEATAKIYGDKELKLYKEEGKEGKIEWYLELGRVDLAYSISKTPNSGTIETAFMPHAMVNTLARTRRYAENRIESLEEDKPMHERVLSKPFPDEAKLASMEKEYEVVKDEVDSLAWSESKRRSLQVNRYIAGDKERQLTVKGGIVLVKHGNWRVIEKTINTKGKDSVTTWVVVNKGDGAYKGQPTNNFATKQEAIAWAEKEQLENDPEGKPTPTRSTVNKTERMPPIGPQFSRGTGEGLTTTQTRAILVKYFGEKVIKALESSGLLTIMATPPSWAEPDADGAYDKDSGKAYLFTDNLSAETVVATLAHELAGHKGFQEMMTPTAYASLMRQFNRLVNQGNAIALAAKARAEAAESTDGAQQDEMLPYLLTQQATLNAGRIQQSAVSKVIEQVYRAVKAWLYRTLSAHGFDGVASKLLQPKDITLLAERMIREMGNGTRPNDSVNSKQNQTNARNLIRDVLSKGKERLSPSKEFMAVIDKAVNAEESADARKEAPNIVSRFIGEMEKEVLELSQKTGEIGFRKTQDSPRLTVDAKEAAEQAEKTLNILKTHRKEIEDGIVFAVSAVESITGYKVKNLMVMMKKHSTIELLQGKKDSTNVDDVNFVTSSVSRVGRTIIKVNLNAQILVELASKSPAIRASGFNTITHELTHLIQYEQKNEQEVEYLGIDSFIPEGITDLHKTWIGEHYPIEEGGRHYKAEQEAFSVGYTAAKAMLKKEGLPLRIISESDLENMLLAASRSATSVQQALYRFDKANYGQDIRFSQLNTPQTQINAVRKKYEGTSQWMKAPNGQPTKLNEMQWLQVRTPNFKAWFGDWENDPANASKVVDENGEPLVVYHGTKSEFTEFDISQPIANGRGEGVGFYFTPDKKLARRYAGRKGFSISAFLSMKNDFRGFDSLTSEERQVYLKTRTDEEAYEKLGIDGFIQGTQYIVRKPTQIKSATDNTGEFNPTNPDIRFSRKAKNPITEGIKSAANDAKNSLPDPIAKSIDNFMAGRILPSSDMANITAKTELSIYKRTIGTQLNTALQLPDFKKVYDMAQRYLQHVAVDAYAALKVAPNLLGKLESWSDLKKDIKKIWPANFIKQKADRAAVASVIFDETLNNELLSDADILKALTRDQRQIYKEARDAIQVSLENTAKSEMVRKLLAAEAINWSTVESLINKDLPVEQFAQTVRDMVESRIGGFKNELKAILDADPKIKDALKTSHDKKLTPQTPAQKLTLKEARLTPEQMRTPAQKLAIEEAKATPNKKQQLTPAQKATLKKAKTLKAQIETTEEALKSLNDVEARLETLIEQGYAPLMRFGEYTLTVKDLDGKVKSFFMFESKSEQVRAVNTIVARYGKTVNLETDMISKEEFKQFAGMTPETVALFAKETGMDKDEAYQHYLKHAIPARSAMTRMIKRKGTEGFSDDIQRVVASFVMSNARMSAKNIYAAQIEKSIQDIESGKSVKDQAIVMKENVFNPKENFAQLRNFLFLWNLGGSIFFGLLNMTQPYMQTLPHLSQYVPIKEAFDAIIKGSGIAGSAMKNGTAPKGYEAEYNRAVREGVVDPQNVFMLSGVERGKTGASNSAWGVITHTMGLIAQVTESFNRKAVFIAALEVANKKGAVWLKKKGFNSAYDFAKDSVDQTQGVYDKANRSNWANTSVGAPLMVFKQFSINYVEQMVRMWKKEAASGDEGKKAVFLMLAMLASLSGMMGLPFIKDILDVSETTAAFLGNPVNIEREARLALGKDLADPLFNGVLNHFVFNQFGVDVQSRTGMPDLVPWSNALNPTLSAQGRINEFASIAGATGGLIEKGYDATQLIARGNLGTAALTLMPRSFTSAFTGGKMAVTDEVMDSKGNKLFDTTWDEGLVKFIDANPKRMADLSRTKSLEWKDKSIQAYMTTNFKQKIIAAMMDNDQAEVQNLMKKVQEWNTSRPKYPVFINLNTLSKNANKKEQTFDARESIPKGMDWMKNERPEM